MRLLPTFFLAAGLVAGAACVHGATVEKPIRLHLPVGIDVERCHVRYMIGGSGSFVRMKPGVFSYEIEVVRSGAVAEQLKAYVACLGFQIEAVTFDPLPPSDRRDVTLSLKAQSTVKFHGKVREWQPQERRLHVAIDFWPSWSCSFFGLTDCMLVPWRVVSVPLDAEGDFTADLPDFATDPTIASVKAPWRPGELMFSIRDADTRSEVFRLHPVGNGPRHNNLPVQLEYLDGQLFDLESPLGRNMR